MTLAINEHWSVRTMNERINSMLFERTLISKKGGETIANDLKILRTDKKMSTDLFFRQPYVLDFFNLADTYSEKDLEDAILHELEKFLLEMGRDFAFMGRQVRITINDKDYYIDLLFYHRKLRRLVVVELKLGEFLPEHKGQVELYLHWLEKYEKQLIASLFGCSVDNISLHLKNIFADKELDEISTTEEFSTVASTGKNLWSKGAPHNGARINERVHRVIAAW
jgi:predicted nuclease of restriction endonuclease-like (RecB) superfamily